MKHDSHLPAGKVLQFVDTKNVFLQQAKQIGKKESQDPKHPTGAVLVKDGIVLGKGANGSAFHTIIGCVRKWFRVKSGTGYHLCPGCATRNHAEQQAIADAKAKGYDTSGADIYLWGHSYCCQWCWAVMIEAGVKNVYLEKK